MQISQFRVRVREGIQFSIWLGIFAAVVFLALAAVMEHLPFTAVDWLVYQDVLSYPMDPYRSDYFNPPWTVWLLYPVKAFTMQVGVVRLITVIVFLALLWSRGGDVVSTALFATSVPFLYLVANGNIEFLPALALLVPDKGIGMILLTTKPQVGILSALAWVRNYDARRLFLPVLAVFLISLLLYGWWPADALYNIARMQGVGLTNVSWNNSLFPWSVPFGLYFAYRAWRDADEYPGVTATWMLSPYLPLYTLTMWFALFLVREQRRWFTVLVWAALWAFYWWRFQ